MKSLSLSRPLIIMVIGIPGSGKSFFARQFAETFAAPLVSVDFLRHTLVPNSSYSQEEDEVIGELTDAQLVELVKTSKSIVVDGGANSLVGRRSVTNLAKKHNYGTLLIWVQTDAPTAELRSLKRSNRRKGDELNSPMSDEAFARNIKAFEQPSRHENYVVISGKHTFATQVRVVLKKIVAPRDQLSDTTAPRTPASRPLQNNHDISTSEQRHTRNLHIS